MSPRTKRAGAKQDGTSKHIKIVAPPPPQGYETRRKKWHISLRAGNESTKRGNEVESIIDIYSPCKTREFG
jgi:hypothetical protein